MKNISFHFDSSLFFEDHPVFDNFRFRLLKAIDEKGSITLAAKELGISYRKAWGDIRKVESLLNVPLCTCIRGGAQNGWAILNENAKILMRAWQKLQKRIRQNSDRAFFAFIKSIQEDCEF